MPLDPVEAECTSSGGTVELDIDGSPVSDTNPLPVEDVATDGVATTTDDVAVTNVAIDVLAANTSRKSAVIQNTGAANVRVSVGSTATASHGVQLVPSSSLVLDQPFVPTARVSAIREGATNSTVAVVEVV